MRISDWSSDVCSSDLTVGPTHAEGDVAHTVQKQSLTLDAARKVLAGAEAEAARNGWAPTIAVVDESGHIVAMERMDSARYAGLYLAPGKARSAALFRRPTKVLEDAINDGRTAQVTLPDMVQMEGGLQDVINGEVVGESGVSGNAKQQDSQNAQGAELA